MKLKLKFEVRELGEKVLLVPVGKAARSMNCMMMLNETGRFLWEHLPNAESEETLVSELLDEYDVDRETAAQDVKEFLANLREHDIV